MSKNNKSERTRAEILDTAWRLIAEQGADVSMSKLAASVGLTRQSIYVHFGSRGGLLVALVNRADEREDIWGAFKRAQESGTAAQRLEGCLRAWFDFVPRIYPVARDLIRLKARDKEAATAWYDRMDALYAFYRERIIELEQEDQLKTGLSHNQAADIIWAQTSVQQWELFVHDRKWSHKQTSDHLIQASLNTICESD